MTALRGMCLLEDEGTEMDHESDGVTRSPHCKYQRDKEKPGNFSREDKGELDTLASFKFDPILLRNGSRLKAKLS